MRLPEWLRERPAQLHSSRGMHSAKKLLRSHRLSTVCEEARCPNRPYCFNRPAAAFMILGDICTRECSFCAVTHGIPLKPDTEEPARLADAVAELGLRHAVITSVSRDDLADGGAAQFAACIREIKTRLPRVKTEVLTPDFNGSMAALGAVLDAGPDVFNHNMETVSRLYSSIRPQASYIRSLGLIAEAKKLRPDSIIKSGFMLGLGERSDEVSQLLHDLRSAGCDAVTIGQYLRPSKKSQPVVEYINPSLFEGFRQEALEAGFSYVASGPLVRSSMNAEEMIR